MNRFSKIILHSAFQFIFVTIGCLLCLFGFITFLFEYELNGNVPEYIICNILPLPIVGASIIVLDVILFTIAKRYDKKTKVRKTEMGTNSSYIYGHASGYSSDSGYSTATGDSKLFLLKQDNNIFIILQGYKVAKVEYVDMSGIKLLGIYDYEAFEYLFPESHTSHTGYINSDRFTKNRFDVLKFKSTSFENDFAVNDFLKSHYMYDAISEKKYLHYCGKKVAEIDDSITGVYTVINVLDSELLKTMQALINNQNTSSSYGNDTATGKSFLTYKGIKIAEVDGRGQIIEILVSELYDEYMGNDPKKHKLDEFNEELRAEIAERLQ